MLGVMKTPTCSAPGTRKVRRPFLGGKRPDGLKRQAAGQRIRRADPTRIRLGRSDTALTRYAGLLPFAQTLHALRLDAQLASAFRDLKPGRRVVYPMASQLHLLLDAFALGELRVFHVEALAADPLFVHLAGGAVPSLDVLYDDLRRFDADHLDALEALVFAHGTADLDRYAPVEAHLDIDTTVLPLFGRQEGAARGPNPRYHGRPSHHPVLARCAELDTWIGARLRSGDQSFSLGDVEIVHDLVAEMRAALAPHKRLWVRIDAAGDYTEFLADVTTFANTAVLTKARITPELLGAIAGHATWRTVDVDAHGAPTVQVATIDYPRPCWRKHGLTLRVVVVRSLIRECGQRTCAWAENDYEVQAFITNAWDVAEEDLARKYNQRAGIEPLIGQGKGALGFGKASSEAFVANEAALLLRLLAWNLLRRHVRRTAPALQGWSLAWLRRALLQPGRLTHSGHRWTLHVGPTSPVARMLN